MNWKCKERKHCRYWFIFLFFYYHFVEVYQTTKENIERHNNTIEITIITVITLPRTCINEHAGQIISMSLSSLSSQLALLSYKFDGSLYKYYYQDAIKHNSYLEPDPRVLTKGDVAAAMATATKMLEGELSVGGQDHCYLEPRACIARPLEHDGIDLTLTSQCLHNVQVRNCSWLSIQPLNTLWLCYIRQLKYVLQRK